MAILTYLSTTDKQETYCYLFSRESVSEYMCLLYEVDRSIKKILAPNVTSSIQWSSLMIVPCSTFPWSIRKKYVHSIERKKEISSISQMFEAVNVETSSLEVSDAEPRKKLYRLLLSPILTSWL